MTTSLCVSPAPVSLAGTTAELGSIGRVPALSAAQRRELVDAAKSGSRVRLSLELAACLESAARLGWPSASCDPSAHVLPELDDWALAAGCYHACALSCSLCSGDLELELDALRAAARAHDNGVRYLAVPLNARVLVIARVPVSIVCERRPEHAKPV